MYGLNDKNSKNYIADQNRRANLLRILMEQSKVLNVTPEEILEIINNQGETNENRNKKTHTRRSKKNDTR